MMHVCDFLFSIENTIKEEVGYNFPRNWDEDFITRSLLKSLRKKFNTRTQIYLDEPCSFCLIAMPFPLRHVWHITLEWDAYKMSGSDENKFGDIAILVVIKYPDGDKVEGVAFLEAKRIYESSHNFEAIDFKQLKRISKHAPKASVLLYDFNSILYDFNPICLCRPYWRIWHTYAVTAPIDLVIATRKRDMSLYKFSIPFSVRLIKHLLGFCLEHADEPIRIAKGYQEKYGTPLYLLVARVGIGVEPPLSDEVEFDRVRAQPLEQTT